MEGEFRNPGMASFGRYRTIRTLGEGAMANVYLAQDPNLSRRVAIKVIKPHLLGSEAIMRRFRAEASVLANLRHPNILQVHDYDIEDGRHYLVMEYAEGPGLQSLLNDLGGRPLPPPAAAWFAWQAAQGLAAAHKLGLVHRDIKPDNMLLTADGTLKIADFGIAHIAELDQTMAGEVLGTPYYMAPEQTLAETPAPQADLWALGVVLYYCLTGRRPFEGAGFPEIKRKIRLGAYRPIADLAEAVDPELIAIADGLLSQDPAARGDAEGLALRLKAYLDRTGIGDGSAYIRDLTESYGLASLDKTRVEFQVAKGPSGISQGKRGKRTAFPEADEEEIEATPEPAPPTENKPTARFAWLRKGGVWILPLALPIGIQVYVRWSIANPPPPKAILEIRSYPTGADISVDGKGLGRAPLTRMLKQGRHRIQAANPAFPGQIEDTTMDLGSGIAKLEFRFQRQKRKPD
jgi:serine/threonine protein kinase